MLSCHPDGPSIIQNEPFNGMSLADYIRIQGREILGSDGIIFEDFPILIKLIDARENLSIQVHPSNLFAMTDFLTLSALGKEILVVNGLDAVTIQLKAIGKNLNQLTVL